MSAMGVSNQKKTERARKKAGKSLMPTKPSRARRWIKEGKAIGKFNDLDIFYVQLTDEPSDNKTQPIAIGIDPGKLFSGIGVQSSLFTLWKAHLELPFKRVRERMDNRRLMRRGRRERRINRQLSFNLRAHRQKRFSNRKPMQSILFYTLVLRLGKKYVPCPLQWHGMVYVMYTQGIAMVMQLAKFVTVECKHQWHPKKLLPNLQ